MISFCDCGTLKQTSTCPNCNSTSPLISKPKTQTRIFSPLPTASIQLETSTQQATIEMSCVKCGKEELSFRTAQLRSSDEGQTIFYHCWGCGYRVSFFPKISKPKPTPLASIFAGALSGLAVDTILFPIDTLKVRLQTNSKLKTSLYKGISSTLMSSAPSSAVFFLIYNSFSNPFIAAPIAETCACLIRVPTDVIRINMQNNLHQTISSAFKAGGLYRGLTATLIRDLPFATIQFSIYEYLKSRSSNQVQVLASASVSASIAAILTTPLDVLKTRMSVCTMKIGIIDHLKEIKRQGAFFKGVKPRVLWITMGGVIYLGVYEQVLKLI